MSRRRWGGLIKVGLVYGLAVLWLLAGQQGALTQLENTMLDFSLPALTQATSQSDDVTVAGCVRLDGYCVFRVAAPKSDLSKRIKTIEAALVKVRNDYIKQPDPTLEVELRQESIDPSTPPTASPDASAADAAPETALKSPSLYLSVVPQNPIKLMSVNRFDANLQGVDGQTAAENYGGQIRASLQRSLQERQPRYLLTQAGICLAVVALLLGISWGIGRRQDHLRQLKTQLEQALRERAQSLSSVLDERQQWNMTEAQLRFAQLLQAGLWIGGWLLILSRFPYTRSLAVQVIDSLYIPVRLLLIALLIYLAMRLSFALINRLTAILASSYDITPELNRRMQLRVNTISQVSRGIVFLVWFGVGLLAALTAIGINIGPFLAGAGIIGVALSLPAQSLIKDAINGFLIILEDQYAVGDVITVHGIRGLVENINLRITQIRDEEGRLVTIPNSEIGVIANHSNQWAQADVYIPISYHTDVDTVLRLIHQTGVDMRASEPWQEAMLVEPEVLGVEEFGERGLMIRVWIKTQPLQQWAVAREYRRRLKVALDANGIVIPAHIDFKAPSPA